MPKTVLPKKFDPAYNPAHLTTPPVRPQWEDRGLREGNSMRM